MSDDLQRPSRSLTYYKPFQMRFFVAVQLVSAAAVCDTFLFSVYRYITQLTRLSYKITFWVVLQLHYNAVTRCKCFRVLQQTAIT